MTATRTLYRRANVSKAQATASLFKRFPNMDLISFTEKKATAEEAAAARAKEGDLVYEAQMRVAEFPPEGGEEESGESEAPKEEKPEAPAEESSDENDEAGDGDGDGDEGGNPFGSKDEGEGEHKGLEPKKLSPEEQIVHLLTQILDALKGGGGPMGHHEGPELGGDLPDIGAPGKGEELPPPPGKGPGGPMGAGGPPLPPPVKEKSPIGAGAFAHVTGKAEIQMVRQEAGEIGNKKIIAEAAEHAPKHRVSKIQRTGIAQIGNDYIDLAEANLALVTLVSR